MSPRTEIQNNIIKEEKRTLILNVALELFSQKGYSATSMSEIAKAAGISKGLPYSYFESKEELLLSLFKIGINQAMEFFDLDKNGILTADEMKHYITEVFKLLQANRSFWKLYFNLFTQPNVYDLIKTEMHDFTNDMSAILIEYFRKKGSLTPEIDTVVFNALMDGISFQYIIEPELFPLDAVVDNVIKQYC
ncbi:MAG: TetR/AcrR family transcriptional regulator [Bacteroidales bacterium]|nr:TetR/AcrR family transcriptional regulator [Bacteroidales bacterium]